RVREKTHGSYERFLRAQHTLAGGVSSGLRRNARPYPLYFRQGQGCHAVDVDGNRYCDYGLAWGPLILGQAAPELVEAIVKQSKRGFTFGAQHDLEFQVSELMAGCVPCCDLVCFANSGTEIVQVALRLARAATGRAKFLKFEGHYHGWDDSVLVSYHPSAAELESANGAPIGAGAGQRPHTDVFVAQWNDRVAVERIFAEHANEISAVICEPMLCNSGCIPPAHGFLEFLRCVTTKHGALLIFDEVITGFRLHIAGAQGHYGVTPDLATYAKAIGGGVAVSALAGKREFMQLIASGKVVHAGTLNGNPIALAAARATLETLSRNRDTIYDRLWEHGERLKNGMQSLLRSAGHKVVTNGGGPVFQLSFMEKRPSNYRETLDADLARYKDFAVAMLDEGQLILPDGRWYISAALTDKDIDATLEAVRKVTA
ncbi:MAG: aspartate aminotransferase family protein, partial [Candidatus Acidiferrales bacterium]